MFWLKCEPPAGEEEEILDRIAVHDPAGIEHTTAVTAWFATREQAEACAGAIGVRSEIGCEPERNWNEAWQSEWRPMAVGERWFLAPQSDLSPTPAGRIRLTLHAGVSFGNGDHPATHLCLAAMEQLLRPGDSFLDIGCGSGLLSVAAMELGAGIAAGCDVDAAAIVAARQHGVSQTWTGSVDAAAARAFDVIAANLPAPVTVGMLPDIGRVARPGARLIVSGLLEDQVPGLREDVTCCGWKCEADWGADGWWAFAARLVAGAAMAGRSSALP